MSRIWAFNHIENKHTLYCRKDCVKILYSSLRESTKNIIDFEKKKMLSFTKEEFKLHQDAKVCCISGKRILKKLSKIINNWEVRDHCHFTGKHRGAAHSI